jgi:hypothetical protein
MEADERYIQTTDIASFGSLNVTPDSDITTAAKILFLLSIQFPVLHLGFRLNSGGRGGLCPPPDFDPSLTITTTIFGQLSYKLTHTGYAPLLSLGLNITMYYFNVNCKHF